MPGREIPRDQWVEFCQGFTRQHAGWLVSLELSGAKGEPRVLARDEPLKAVSAELEEPGGEDKILISTGSEPEGRTLQAVRRPTSLRFEETREGAHEGLRIDSEDGAVTRVRFRSAVPPEAVDGYTPPP